jgi:parallel beta-helix repeat protein
MPRPDSTRRWWRFIIAPLVAILLAAVPATAYAGRDGTLTIRSDTTLSGDVFVPVVVARDGITLDCAGHEIKGSGNGKGITVDGRSRVTVRNCDVSNFGTGILVANTSDSTIEANSFHDNRVPGGGNPGWVNSAGVWVQDSSDNTFVGNLIYANAGDGFDAFSSTNNLISDNTFSGNALAGLFFGNHTNGNLLQGNTAEENGASGFFVVDNASDNTLIANVASGNAWQGFDLGGTSVSGNILIENTAFGNDNGFLLNPGASGNSLTGNNATGNNHGILLVGVSGNTLTGNVATMNDVGGFVLSDASGNTLNGNDGSANRYGFAAVGASSSNVFSENVAHGNAEFDGYQDVTGFGNTWIDNDFGTTFGL